MSLEIRRARAEEARLLQRIARTSKGHWGYPEEYLRLWEHDLSVTADFVERHPVWCATLGAKVVGFYALSDEGETRELEHMWVDPEHIGTGVGTCLFRHALDVLRAAGATALRIASDPHAETFYLRMGARRIGDVPSTPEGRRLPLLEIALGAP